MMQAAGAADGGGRPANARVPHRPGWITPLLVQVRARRSWLPVRSIRRPGAHVRPTHGMAPAEKRSDDGAGTPTLE